MFNNISSESALSREAAMSMPPVPPVAANTKNWDWSGLFNSAGRRARHFNRKKFEPTLTLAIEIAREGREGRRIGTLFTFGHARAVMERSRPIILDPLARHAEEARRIDDPNLRGTIKELAQLDGAFVVSDDGVVVSACRYLDAPASGVPVPFGMGSRHLAGASISRVLRAGQVVFLSVVVTP